VLECIFWLTTLSYIDNFETFEKIAKEVLEKTAEQVKVRRELAEAMERMTRDK